MHHRNPLCFFLLLLLLFGLLDHWLLFVFLRAVLRRPMWLFAIFPIDDLNFTKFASHENTSFALLGTVEVKGWSGKFKSSEGEKGDQSWLSNMLHWLHSIPGFKWAWGLQVSLSSTYSFWKWNVPLSIEHFAQKMRSHDHFAFNRHEDPQPLPNHNLPNINSQFCEHILTTWRTATPCVHIYMDQIFGSWISARRDVIKLNEVMKIRYGIQRFKGKFGCGDTLLCLNYNTSEQMRKTTSPCF